MKRLYDSQQLREYLAAYDLTHLFLHTQLEHLQLREYDSSEIILREGDELDGLYFQVDGVARVSTCVATGKSLLLRYCRPLSVFGDIELINNVPVQSRVEADERSRFIFIDKAFVQRHFMQDSQFLNMLLKHLAYKLQTCTTASRINLLATVEERLAGYLLSTREPIPFGQEIYSPHISEIASVIGTTTRHLNRVLQNLKDDGIVSKTRNNLIVLDWEQLDRMSNGLRYD
jgi:CRP-like cAMP-binding protein